MLKLMKKLKKHVIDKLPKLLQAKCTKCDKTFVKNCELERHILEHHEYKPFDWENVAKLLFSSGG